MGLLDKIEKSKSTEGGKPGTDAPVVDEFYELKNKIHNQVLSEINKQEQKDIGDEFIRKIIGQAAEENGADVGKTERTKLQEDVYNDIMGYGPLEELLKDPEITEIMVNGPAKIFVEKKGKLQMSSLRFRDDEHVMNVIDRIVSLVGRHIDDRARWWTRD
jgi:pilus assembly protein CpaF